MKITPLEIRQKDFEKKLRGYDKDEVQAFLLSLSNEWERVVDENKELRIKLDQAVKETQKLREVESSLYKTLKTAEDTGANLVDQANKAADLHLKETQMNAEAMMSESKQKAQAIIEKADQKADGIINEVQEGVQELELNYKTIKNLRDNLIKDLMNLSDDIVERVQRMDKKKSEFSLQKEIQRVKNLSRKSEKHTKEKHLDVTTVPIKHISMENVQQEVARATSKELEEKIIPVVDKKKITIAESPTEASSQAKTDPKEKNQIDKEVKDFPEQKSQGSFFDKLEEY